MSILDHFRKPRTNLVASILEFPALDTDGMIKKMKLKELGRERGERNLPSSDSEVFDAIEQSIINEIENEAKTQFSSYLDHQKTYAERAGDVNIQTLIVGVKAIAADAITDLERKTQIGTSDLYSRKRDLIESERDLRQFRERHALERPARDYGEKTFKIGVLIFILALEASLNGAFLSKGSEAGLIGGVFQALIIASINVFVGVVAGWRLFPWTLYRDIAVRILASAGIAVYLIFNFGFNLAIAHYRNAISADPFDASSLAYRSFLSSPMGIDDMQSWALFMIGFTFSLIAAYDGFRMDDPYPGYGQRMRQNLEAHDEYTAEKDALLAQLHQIKKSAEEKMDDLVRTIQNRQGEYNFILKKSGALKQSMLQHYIHLESAANTLLSYYRDENRAHRTSPVPARFNVRYTFDHPSLEIAAAVNTSPAESNDALSQALEEIPKHRESLHAGFRKAYAEYKRIDDLVTIEPSP